MDNGYIVQRIETTKAAIIAYEDAIDAILVGGHQKYVLDTGQSSQTVTRLDVNTMQEKIDLLYSRLDALCARAGLDRSVVTVCPGF